MSFSLHGGDAGYSDTYAERFDKLEKMVESLFTKLQDAEKKKLPPRREGRETEAVVDTAAGIAPMHPSLAEELKLKMKPWVGSITTVSGQGILPKGVVYPRIFDGEKTITEEVVVMEMSGVELLLGLNTLTALGTRIRVGATPEIRLGSEIPVCVLNMEPRPCRLRATEKQEIPPRARLELPSQERAQIVAVLRDSHEAFAMEGAPLGVCNAAVHEVETGPHRPIRQQPYSSAWKERQLIHEQVEKMLERDIIEASASPWASPVVLVKKKDGQWRFCVDYRRLNTITTKDVYPLPRIEEALARLEGSAYFSIMDLESGYWQVQIRDPTFRR